MRITDRSERGRRSLVVASQAVGVLAVCRPHRRPIPAENVPKLYQNFTRFHSFPQISVNNIVNI